MAVWNSVLIQVTAGTTGQELREMRDWLKISGCILVAMKSTGVYWKPVYAELEGHFEQVVGNAQHSRPPRQTIVAEYIEPVKAITTSEHHDDRNGFGGQIWHDLAQQCDCGR